MTHVIRDVLIAWIMRQDSHGDSKPDPAGVAIVGCARGEVHELGSLMVRLLLEQAGWKVVYLGLNVPTEEFADQQLMHGASLVCVSMSPPAGKAEAQTIVNLLNRMYVPSKPYRLALGGAAVQMEDKQSMDETAFADIEFFTALSPFSTWMAGQEGRLNPPA